MVVKNAKLTTDQKTYYN